MPVEPQNIVKPPLPKQQRRSFTSMKLYAKQKGTTGFPIAPWLLLPPLREPYYNFPPLRRRLRLVSFLQQSTRTMKGSSMKNRTT